MKSVMSEHQFEKLAEYSDGAAYRVLVKINMNLGWIENVKCCIENLRQKQMFQMKYKCQEDDFACFELYINLPTQAVFYYYFSFEANGQFYYYKKTNETGNQCVSKEECWKLSVNFEVPDWAQGAIMYHIFVDRYRRGSKAQLPEMPYRKIHKSWNEQPVIGPDEDGLWNVDFYGGDIRGIIETLPYIKRLGVDIIYLSPIVRSQSNHRYDTTDYFEVDPFAGTYEDLKELCNKAHKKGMRVILDGVFNHTGNDCRYYNQWNIYDEVGAFQSEHSPYSNYYVKSSNNAPENREWYQIDENADLTETHLLEEEVEKIKCCVFEKNLLTNKWNIIDPQARSCSISSKFIQKVQYALKRMNNVCWWYFLNLPKMNTDEVEIKKLIISVVVFWAKEIGIDGVRLDVADDLTDEIMMDMRTETRKINPDFFITGEIWYNPMKHGGRAYLSSGKCIDSVMNYYLMDAMIRYLKYANVELMKARTREIFSEYPDGTLNSAMNSTSTHDISRQVELGYPGNYFKEDGEWGWSLKNQSFEWARKHSLTAKQYKLAKEISQNYTYMLAFFPGTISIFYGDEVGLKGIGNLANRAPYPWGKRDKKVLKFFRNILHKRKQESFLRKAAFRIVKIDEESFAFERYDDSNKLLVAISRVNKTVKLDLPEEYANAEILLKKKNCSTTSLAPYGAIVLKK